MSRSVALGRNAAATNDADACPTTAESKTARVRSPSSVADTTTVGSIVRLISFGMVRIATTSAMLAASAPGTTTGDHRAMGCHHGE
jgi:hypothetical protein